MRGRCSHGNKSSQCNFVLADAPRRLHIACQIWQLGPVPSSAVVLQHYEALQKETSICCVAVFELRQMCASRHRAHCSCRHALHASLHAWCCSGADLLQFYPRKIWPQQQHVDHSLTRGTAVGCRLTLLGKGLDDKLLFPSKHTDSVGATGHAVARHARG